MRRDSLLQTGVKVAILRKCSIPSAGPGPGELRFFFKLKIFYQLTALPIV